MPKHQSPPGFTSLGVSKELADLLRQSGIVTPTPIQDLAIPIAMDDRDVIGLAETGTGKTLAFGLPMVSRLRDGETGLVVAPTRELAEQIAETFTRLRVRACLVVGGKSMGVQVSQLRRRPSVIVATPGRLIDHMNQGTVDLTTVGIVVLDEADRMLDMGFAPSIRRILSAVPRDRQTMLFSATLPKEIASLASQYLRDPERVEASRPGKTPTLVTQELVFLEHEHKPTALGAALDGHAGPVLVFARTRHGARKLAKIVRGKGHAAAELHSDRTQVQRKEALDGFKSGKYRVLVATDIAARGIDVKGVELVLNYDVPGSAEDYVHRIGRTGRAGAAGKAMTFVLPTQGGEVRDIERLLGSNVTVSDLSTATPLTGSKTRTVSIGKRKLTTAVAPPAYRPGRLFGREPEPTTEPRPEGRSDHRAPKSAPVPPSPARPGHRGWSGRSKRGRR